MDISHNSQHCPWDPGIVYIDYINYTPLKLMLLWPLTGLIKNQFLYQLTGLLFYMSAMLLCFSGIHLPSKKTKFQC